MRAKEAVAPEQLTLPDMPAPEFDTRGFSETAIARAQRKVDLTVALRDAHPDLMSEAAQMAAAEAAQRGRVGVRWLGEALRIRLRDEGAGGLSNDCVGVLVRMLCADEPWLRPHFESRRSAVDVVLAREAERHV